MTVEQNTEALKKARIFSDNKDKIDGFYNGYVQATIDLEKENAELTETINKLREQLSLRYDLEDKIKELEKENTELKGLKDVATLIRANNDTVITLMQLNNMLVSKSQQLTKAKEILTKLLEEENNNMYWEMDGSDKSSYYKARKQAKQFLKEIE